MGLPIRGDDSGKRSVTENLDRLADLLREQSPDRQAAFWSDVMGKRGTKAATTISDQLRQAIAASGLTHYAIGKLADVDPGMISRFVTGGTLRLTTVDKLAAALGLRLTEGEQPK
jgi:hypothetical protein